MIVGKRMAEMHQLSAHCRVCGGRLERSRRRNPKYSCLSYQEALETTFGLVVKLDFPAIHPAYFCNSCCATTRKKKAAVSKGVLYRHSITLFNWTEHIIDDCTVSIEQNRFTKSCIHYRYASILRVLPCLLAKRRQAKIEADLVRAV